MWVLVRSSNGSVTHFETVSGFEYLMEERWKVHGGAAKEGFHGQV